MEEVAGPGGGSRHRRVTEIAELVDARSKARQSSTLFAIYQKTREYRSAPGVKAARTRRRNAAQEGDALMVEEDRIAQESDALAMQEEPTFARDA